MVLGKKGADMKGHCRGQQGAILVLTAFLLPFIIAFTGLAVDLGNLYVQPSAEHDSEISCQTQYYAPLNNSFR